MDPFHGSRILTPGRPQKELQAGNRASVDVASHQVLIPLVHRFGAKDRPAQDALAKAGRKAFHLRFDCLQRGSRPAIGHMAVGPRHVLAGGRPAGVEKSWLREQDKGVAAHRSAPRLPLRSSNLLEGTAQMDRAGAQAFPGTPRNRLAQGPIYFEDAGTVAVTLQLPAEGRLNLFAANTQQLPGGHIQERQIRMAQLSQREHTRVGGNRAPSFLQAGQERIRDGLRAALRNGPAHGVGGNP